MNFYRFEERDVFMSKRYLSELKSKLPPGDLKLPQVFLNDQLVGVSLIMLLQLFQPITLCRALKLLKS